MSSFIRSSFLSNISNILLRASSHTHRVSEWQIRYGTLFPFHPAKTVMQISKIQSRTTRAQIFLSSLRLESKFCTFMRHLHAFQSLEGSLYPEDSLLSCVLVHTKKSQPKSLRTNAPLTHQQFLSTACYLYEIYYSLCQSSMN